MLLGKQDKDKKRLKPHQGCGGGIKRGGGLPSNIKAHCCSAGLFPTNSSQVY